MNHFFKLSYRDKKIVNTDLKAWYFKDNVNLCNISIESYTNNDGKNI